MCEDSSASNKAIRCILSSTQVQLEQPYMIDSASPRSNGQDLAGGKVNSKLYMYYSRRNPEEFSKHAFGGESRFCARTYLPMRITALDAENFLGSVP